MSAMLSHGGLKSATVRAILQLNVECSLAPLQGRGHVVQDSSSAGGPARWVGERWRSPDPRRPIGDGDGPTTDQRLVAAVRRGDDRAFEQLYSRYQRRISRLRARDGQGPRPRRGRHAGGLRLRAAADARHRPADRLQALDLRDRQERLHRPVPPLPARRGGLLRRRRRPRRRPTTAGSSPPSPTPDAAVDAKQRARPPVRRVRRPVRDAPRDPRAARARGPLLPRDRRPHGHEPPGRREHALPRPPAADRGVRRARLRRSAACASSRSSPRPAAPRPARATRAASRATSRTASRAAARRWPPGSTSRRCPRDARPPRASSASPGFLPLPGFLRARFFAGSEQMVPVSEPMAAAWSKAVAAGAALLVAGVGAGVAPHGGGYAAAAQARQRQAGGRAPARRDAEQLQPRPAPAGRGPAADRVAEVHEPHRRAPQRLARQLAAQHGAAQHRQRPATGQTRQPRDQARRRRTRPAPRRTRRAASTRRRAAAARRRRACRRSRCRRSTRASAPTRSAARSTRR